MNDVKFRKYIGDMMNVVLDLSTLPQNNTNGANYSVSGNIVYNSTGVDGKAWTSSAISYDKLKPNTKYIFFVKNLIKSIFIWVYCIIFKYTPINTINGKSRSKQKYH